MHGFSDNYFNCSKKLKLLLDENFIRKTLRRIIGKLSAFMKILVLFSLKQWSLKRFRSLNENWYETWKGQRMEYLINLESITISFLVTRNSYSRNVSAWLPFSWFAYYIIRSHRNKQTALIVWSLLIFNNPSKRTMHVKSYKIQQNSYYIHLDSLKCCSCFQASVFTPALLYFFVCIWTTFIKIKFIVPINLFLAPL